MKKYIIISFVFILSLFILNINSVYALRPAGCAETSNYSITTGQSCSVGEGSYSSTYLPSCSSLSGYSLIKGQSCSVLAKTNTAFNFKAKDPDGGNLSWSIDWGDNNGLSKTCPSFYPNTTFSSSHAWTTAGTYNVKLGVSNCKESGDASASFNVVVKNADTVSTSGGGASNSGGSIPVNSNTESASKTKNPSPADCTGDALFSTVTGRFCKQDTTFLPGELYKSLPPPLNFNAKAISKISILTTWDPVVGADGYNIYRDGKLIARTIKGTNSVYDNYALVCDKTYEYYVEAFKYGYAIQPTGSGNISSKVSVKTDSCGSYSFIKVLSPNGGEKYKQGDTVKITWKATGLTTANNSIGVGIYDISNYSRPVFSKTWGNDENGSVISDMGSYDWTIAKDFSPGKYVIWLTGTSGNSLMQDNSDTAFTVTNSDGSMAITPVSQMPTINISASPTTVSSGGSVTLTWSSTLTNSTSCKASGDWSGAKLPSGTQLMSNLTSSKTYILTCIGTSGNSLSTSATVNIIGH